MQNTIRYALFMFIVSGLLFTACSSDPVVEEDTAEERDSATEQVEELEVEGVEEVEEVDESDETSVYEDGVYSASGAYVSPAGPETIGVSITVEGDKVTAVNLSNEATNEASINFQKLFIEGISAEVIGKSLDEIGGYSSINGASLTPDGFDSALVSIKAAAAL